GSAMSQLVSRTSGADAGPVDEGKEAAEGNKQVVVAKPADFGRETGAEMPPLVDGTRDNSLTAQRRLRGILFIINLLAMAMNVLLVFLVVSSVTGKRIRYVPLTETVIDPEARQVTDNQIVVLSKMLVSEMETWTDATISTTYNRINPWIDATFVDELAAHYGSMTDRVRGSAQTRYCTPYAARINQRAETFIEVIVPYELVVLSGMMDLESKRSIITEARRMAVLRFVRRAPTEENPFGLFLKQVNHFDREDWLASGRTDIWTTYATSRGQ
ncbi:MAG: hypothetical protein ACOCXA_01585, partial [Planctomycetota bacterium]